MPNVLQAITRVVVLLIRATNYDDRGYPRRFHFGVLPSNSLATMNALTEQALEQIKADKSLAIKFSIIEVFDDAVYSQRVSQPEKLVEEYLDGRTIVIVGLVGVQTNQFPRANDLAVRFKKAGAQVVMGGFHVSGSIASLHDGISERDSNRKDIPCPHIMPEEIKKLMDDGIIICCGEAETIWKQIITDIISGKNEMFYRNTIPPDLTDAPLPKYPKRYFKKFATPISTFDISRGCPYACKFCTVINVQGRKLRSRDPQKVLAMIESQCQASGSINAFFTDDNFARNPNCLEILDGLIALREKGYNISFMIQADVGMIRVPDFIEKLGQAGCAQVFIGIESVSEANLEQVGKNQNDIEEYKELFDKLHEHGIAVHASYIIGFAADTRDSILQCVEKLKSIGADQASFFIMMPLPGSEDHVRAKMAGIVMDGDFNKYDGLHNVIGHPNMSTADLEETIRLCYRSFYSLEHMITVLRRTPKHYFWNVFTNFIWYRNSILSESVHPMMCGFLSVRNRNEKRPGTSRESLMEFWKKELWFKLRYFGCLIKEFYIFQYVYFESTGKIENLKGVMSQKLAGIKDWINKTFRLEPSRNWLNNFWKQYGHQKWSLFWKFNWHWRMIPHAITEVVYSWKFWQTITRNIKLFRKK